MRRIKTGNEGKPSAASRQRRKRYRLMSGPSGFHRVVSSSWANRGAGVSVRHHRRRVEYTHPDLAKPQYRARPDFRAAITTPNTDPNDRMPTVMG